MNRREFLGSAAAALCTGCARQTPPPLPPGALLGPDLQLGHRLRDGGFPAASDEQRLPLLIIGGGIAGLSAAWRLRKAGFSDFLLLEMETLPGGNARWGENSVSRYPWGAHYLPLPGPEAVWVRELLADLGVLHGDPAALRPEYDERYLCHAPQERLYIHGQWQEGLLPQFGVSAAVQAQYRQFDAQMQHYKQLRGNDGRRAFAIPSALSSDDPQLRALDRISMADWLLQQQLSAKSLHWLVNYACRDDYGTDYRQTSAWAGIHYFASRNGEAANAAGDCVLTWPEGNGWIVRQLQQRLAQQIRPRQMATGLQIDRDAALLQVWDAQQQRSYRLRARQLIWAAPLFALPHVWPQLPAGWQQAIRRIEYAPWLVANLSLDGLPHDRGHAPLAWDNVLYDSAGLGYVIATHQQLRVREQQTVLTWYQALTQLPPAQMRQQLLQTSHADWSRRILAELSRPHPEIAHQTTRLDIWRWGHAMAQPRPGLTGSAALAALRQPHGPLQLAHSDLSGLSLFEEAQYWGVRAAETALASLGG